MSHQIAAMDPLDQRRIPTDEVPWLDSEEFDFAESSRQRPIVVYEEDDEFPALRAYHRRQAVLMWLLVLSLIGGVGYAAYDLVLPMHRALAYERAERVRIQSDLDAAQAQAQGFESTKKELRAQVASMLIQLSERDARIGAQEAAAEARAAEATALNEMANDLAARLETVAPGAFVPAGDRPALIVDYRKVFESDQVALSAEGQTLLDQVAEAMEGLSLDSIEVIGHAASRPVTLAMAKQHGTVLALSSRRAALVAEALQARLKVPVRAVGVGDSEPRASNRSRSGRTENRRMELVLHRKPIAVEPAEVAKPETESAKSESESAEAAPDATSR